MKNKKKVLLVGMGSEIGSYLLSINHSKKDKIEINAVLTNKIYANDTFQNLKSLQARIIINDPSYLNLINIDKKNSCLIINKKKVKIFWGDIKKFNLKNIRQRFDATIIATSKKHISDKKIMSRFLKISKYVFGVAESKKMPSLYPNLIGLKSSIITGKSYSLNSSKNKVFALGSCQSNGWQAQLRAVLEFFNNKNVKNFKMLATELDIVHPDTPQGRLGTKSYEPREQDARNNLRPGFSQANISMKKLFPKIHTLNTISLRTLVTPPGYQICRFYFSYQLKNKKRLHVDDLIKSFKLTSLKYPNIISVTENSLGSRAYEKTESSAVTLIDKKYVHFNNNLFLNKNSNNEKDQICEIITQSFVHNTKGYCRSVLNTLQQVLNSKKNHKKINYWN